MPEEEIFSPSAVMAQAAALGAQAVQTLQVTTSDTVRPQMHEAEGPKPGLDGELTDAPLEDGILLGGDEGEAAEDGNAFR